MVDESLPCPSGCTVTEWISQLEKLGLLETAPSHLEHDLDFTGSFELGK